MVTDTTRIDVTSDVPTDGLLPWRVRRVGYAALALLLTFTGYLLTVRGPALFFDLAQSSKAFFCM